MFITCLWINTLNCTSLFLFSVLFQFCSVLFCSVLFCSVLFCSILLCSNISGNGRYRSIIHPPSKSTQTNHIVPPNRNMLPFVMRSHRHDMRGIQVFPYQLSVLNLYPSIAAPRLPRWLRTIPASL